MTRPRLPYLLFHPKFVGKFGNKRGQLGDLDDSQLIRSSLQKKWWRAGCFAIDIDLRRFELLDVKNKGVAWTPWNIFHSEKTRILNVQYVFADEFEQLTFDQARTKYVEAVCKGRWCKHSGESVKEFRARNATYSSWEELIADISLAGWLP